MTILLKTAAAGLVLIAASACSEKAQSPAPAPTAEADATPAATPIRIRGTAQTVGADALTVQTYDGKTVNVSLGDKTRYAWLVASSLSTLKNGDFIGTATTGPDSDLKAVELVIFPEALRGTGEGHYPWDVPAAIAAKDQGASAGQSAMTNGAVVQGAMTNGTVQQGAMTNGTVQQSAMTNGTVSSGAGKTGGTRLTISYKGGTSEVQVPPGIPVVRIEPTDKASLATGQKLFVVAAPGPDGTPVAQSVAMGKDGLMPPM